MRFGRSSYSRHAFPWPDRCRSTGAAMWGEFDVEDATCPDGDEYHSSYPRYTEILYRLQEDGFRGDSWPQYYEGLLQRIADAAEGSEERKRLERLRYDFERLPMCTKRAVYVVRIAGRGGCFSDSGEFPNKALRDFVHNTRHGAYWEGFWDFYFAIRQCSDRGIPAERIPWQIVGDPWSDGITHLLGLIKMMPEDARLIIVGTSLGGTAAIKISDALRGKRSIDHLIVYDPVGFRGYREPTQQITIPADVKHFYNRWQEKGCWPEDYKRSGVFAVEDSRKTEADQRKLDLPGVEGGDCKGTLLDRQPVSDAHGEVGKPHPPEELGIEKAIELAVMGRLFPSRQP